MTGDIYEMTDAPAPTKQDILDVLAATGVDPDIALAVLELDYDESTAVLLAIARDNPVLVAVHAMGVLMASALDKVPASV